MFCTKSNVLLRSAIAASLLSVGSWVHAQTHSPDGWTTKSGASNPSYKYLVTGSNQSDAQQRSSVNVNDVVPDDRPDGTYQIGIESRLRDTADSLSVGGFRYAIGGQFDAITQFATELTKGGGAIGLAGRAVSYVANWSDSTNPGSRLYYGVTGSVTFSDPFTIAPGTSTVKVNSGQMATAASSFFAVIADNGHFHDTSTTYSKPGIKDAVGVMSSYFTGLSGGLVSSATSGPDQGVTGQFGCLRDRFDGFLVTTNLNARPSSQSMSNYNGSFDRINQWSGLRVVAPVKRVKSDTTVNQQSYADKAFGTAVGVKIEAPAAPVGATGSLSDASPGNYVGLQVNAKSQFTAPIDTSGRVTISDALRLVPRHSAPPSPLDGTLWLNSNGELSYYFGGTWMYIPAQ